MVVVVAGADELVVEDDGTVELTEDVGGAVEVCGSGAVVVAGWIDVVGATVVGAAATLVVRGIDVGWGTGSGAGSGEVIARHPTMPARPTIAAAAAPSIQGESEARGGGSATGVRARVGRDGGAASRLFWVSISVRSVCSRLPFARSSRSVSAGI